MCIGNLFKAPKAPKFQPPPPPPQMVEEVEADAQADAAASDARTRARRRSITRSTLLTSPFGVTGEAEVERKTLLGA